MKRIINRVMTVFMAVIFLNNITVNAQYSNEYAKTDYRDLYIKNTNNQVLNKPTAQFMAKRISNNDVVDGVISYDGYDCNTEFPQIVCYVGDKIAFEDLSRDNNTGGAISEWDWQHYGTMGDHNQVYNYDIVNYDSYYCDTPGETIFYLCVKNDKKVKKDSCDPWSDNGNHQIKGRNKWYPNGIYWYFTAIKVIVKPVYDAEVQVRYWDASSGKVIDEEIVDAGKIENDSDIKTKCINIKDLEGYEYSGWKVRLENDTVQYSGDDKEVCIELSSYLPKKYLDIEYYPYSDVSVDIRYWDLAENMIIKSERVTGEKVMQETSFSIPITTPENYRIDGWNVQLDDGTIQYTGTDDMVIVVLSNYLSHKYLNVDCSKIADTPKENDSTDRKRAEVTYVDEESNKILDTDIFYGNNTLLPEDISVDIKNIEGYEVTDWTITNENGETENIGINSPVTISFKANEKVKYLVVNCIKKSNGGGDNESEPIITIKPSEDCNGIIEWTETDYHEVANGYYSNGRRKYKKCYHTFTYSAVLNADTKITPDTFKSGYGFELDVNCKITKTLVSNTGDCRAWGNNRTAKSSVANPTKSTVYIPWNMTNSFGIQSTVIPMDSNGALKFILPKSNMSSIGARKIYTPPELAGTEETPVSHSFEVYINGGGIGNVEFCKKLIGTITINGVMYDDDFSGAD